MRKSLSLIIFLLTFSTIQAQTDITADFILPDTTCVGSPITITNLTTGGTTYYWNFCSGNANQNPTGLNIGNPGGLLDIPTYLTLVKDGSNCYSFISCQGVGVVRYFHGNSFKNYPISWTNLGTFGIIDFSEEGIQVKKDNGTWYAIVCSNTTLVRLNFGSSLANTPTATDIGPFPGLVMLHGLSLLQEGTTWIAFATCSTGNKLVRFNFGNSLANTPTMTNFGAMPGFSSPGPICPVLENGLWYLLIMAGNNTLSRITLGTSLLNTPTGENLGNPGGFNYAVGLMVIRDCGATVGYWCNYITPGQIGKLTFNGGVTGSVTGQILGNIGNLDKPHCFSELFRQNDTLYAYVTNRPGFLSRLTFPPCTNASIPSSTAFNPPVYSYNTPGTYNVSLLVDEGLPTQATVCKSIVVGPVPVTNLGADRTICPGTTTVLDAGAGFSHYLWSTGAVTRTITVGTAGTYWVKVTNYSCIDYDTIAVSLYPPVNVNIGPDTTICQGSSFTFDAGACAGCTYLWGNITTGNPNIGTGSTYTTGVAGTYMVTKTNANGCTYKDTATLATTPVPVMTLFPLASTICSGTTTNIILTANLTGTTFSWTAALTSGNITGFSNGTGNVIAQTLVNLGATAGTVSYTITPHKGSCSGTPVVYIQTVNPAPVVNLGPDRSICPGFSTVLDAGAGFTAYLWSTGASTQTITVSTTGTYWVKVTKSGCDDYDTIAVLYYPPVPLNLGPDATICMGQTHTFNAGVCAGCTYLWGNLTTGNPNIGTGATYTTGTAGTYMVTKTDANGCIKRDTATLSTTPLPVMTVFPLSATICSGTTTSINLTASLPGTTFTWVAALASGTITGFSNGSGNLIAQTLTNTGIAAGTVSYTITPSNGICAGSPVIYTVTVNPAPMITNTPVTDSVCSGGTTNIALVASVPGATFSWTATAVSPDLSGFASGSGPLIAQTLLNSGYSMQVVTYHITASAMGCNGPVLNYTVVVKPIPNLLITPAVSAICRLGLTNITLGSAVAGTTFSWIATGSSPAVFGYTDGSFNFIAQYLDNSGFNNETVTYTITPEAFGCTGMSDSATVTVYPTPDVTTSAPSSSICSGDIALVAVSSTVAGATFTWTCSGSSGSVTGFSPGTGDTINQQLFNSGNIDESVTYMVISSANGCPGDTTYRTITVRPLPPVLFSPLSLSLCSGASTSIALSSPVASTVFSWTCTPSSPDVTGCTAGSGPVITDILQNSGFSSGTATYHIAAIAAGCTGPVVHYPVTVFPVPDVIFTPPLTSVCSGFFTNITLSGNVSGTSFTWTATPGSLMVSGYSGGTGVLVHQQLFNADFNPGTVTYTVTPAANGCTGTAGITVVTIEPKPIVNFPVCFDTITLLTSKPFVLKGGTPLGGSYSGSGVNSGTGVFTPAAAGTGLKQITYTYTRANGCSSSAVRTITVITPPAFTCGNPLTDIRTGQPYPTVLLAGQCWMASNLNYGSNVPSNLAQRDNCIPEKYCYDDMGSHCVLYGGLYQWDEMMTYTAATGGQGLCPPSWHVPTESDWNTLFSFYINNAFAGKPLLYTGYSGFNALLAGTDFFNTSWSFTGFATLLWSSDAQGPFKAWSHGMNNPNYSVSFYPSFRSNAFSVRCIRD